MSGATIAAGAAGAGTVTAANGVDQLARANATEAHARRAFDSDLGRELLRELSAHGYLELPTFDALNVDGVTAARTFSLDQVTVTEGRHEEKGSVVGFIVGLENDEFDGPISVRLFPDAGIAGATAERDGESVVLSPGYGGFRLQSDVEPMGCNTCVSYGEYCNDYDCDCGRECPYDTDQEGEYRAHTTCSDGRVECGDCWLCCGGCGW